MCPDLLYRAGQAANPHLYQAGKGNQLAKLAAHPVTPIPRAPGWPRVPGTLLHCGADKLADQRQELLRVPGVKLLQQGEQSQDERRPVHGVGRFSADHPCKATQVTGHAARPGTSLWRRWFRANAPAGQRVCGPTVTGAW